MTAQPLLVDQPRPRARPSATRSQSLRRHQAVRRVQQGNAGAMQHGIRAEMANLPDVLIEVALLYAATPGLDPIRDRRLVELAATTNIALARCVLALDANGQQQHLTAYHSKLAPLAERLERTLYERAAQRLAEAQRGADPLAAYRTRPRADP